jgi:hypothetical protein
VCEVIVQQPRPHEWLVFGLGACLWYVPCNSHGREPLDRDSVSRSVDGRWPKSASYIRHVFSLPEASTSISSVRLARCRGLVRPRTSSQLFMGTRLRVRIASSIKRDTLLLNDFFEAAAKYASIRLVSRPSLSLSPRAVNSKRISGYSHNPPAQPSRPMLCKTPLNPNQKHTLNSTPSDFDLPRDRIPQASSSLISCCKTIE